MNLELLNYGHCLTNLANSILKEFGAITYHETMPEADSLFASGYDNIVVILLDGMGSNILKQNLSEDGFFRKHLYTEFSSVFPPTTVAATTSLRSGLHPSEHSWLGWDCYFPPVDQNVTIFRNTNSETKKKVSDDHIGRMYCPYKELVTLIQEAGKEAYFCTPYDEPHLQTFEEQCDRILKLCSTSAKKFIYAYSDEPDHTMHRAGISAKDSIRVLKEHEEMIRTLVDKLQALPQKTLVLVTADHGHIDSKGDWIGRYPDVCECLVRMPSIEPRALNLYIKPEWKDRFSEIFLSHFGDQFELLTREEIVRLQIFGPGKEHEQFQGMVGDYVAIATGDLTLFNVKEEVEKFIGVHAGLTRKEMEIPLITFTCGGNEEL